MKGGVQGPLLQGIGSARALADRLDDLIAVHGLFSPVEHLGQGQARGLARVQVLPHEREVE